MRTIVFSDVHGEPDIIRGVLAHSGFSAGEDRLVFAGDAIDIGRDSGACLELLDELGAEFLVGNHEYGTFVDWGFEVLDRDVVETVKRSIESGKWALAAEAEGVLVTHAGVSAQWEGRLKNADGSEVAAFVEVLNSDFRRVIEGGLEANEDVVDHYGPLWWRPGRGERELPGVVQVLGHTPPEMLGSSASVDALAEGGFHLVDPFVRRWAGQGFPFPVPVRYAVIEGGAVRVVDAGLAI